MRPSKETYACYPEDYTPLPIEQENLPQDNYASL